MRKPTVYAFTTSSSTADTISKVMEGMDWPVIVEMGDINHAISIAHGWSHAPEILVIDISAEADPQAALARFGEEAPEGETSLLVIGAGDDVKTYRAFKAMGALEYIAAPVASEEFFTAMETVRKAMEAKNVSGDPSKMIIVTSARGGAGGSTLAAELARGIARKHGKKTLLMDLDVEGGCQHSFFNVDPTTGLGMMLESPENVDALFLNRTIVKPADKSISILSDAAPESMGRFNPNAPAKIAGKISKDLDVLVFDAPARSPFLKELCVASETLVVVSPATFHGLRDTLSIVDLAEKHGGIKRVIVVINRAGEVRTGFVGPDSFKQKLAKGSRPDFRDEITVLTLPYAPKPVIRAANSSEALIDDANSPIAKALLGVIDAMPTAPEKKKRARGFLGLLG
jgi:pilus assembly protein CpaE